MTITIDLDADSIAIVEAKQLEERPTVYNATAAASIDVTTSSHKISGSPSTAPGNLGVDETISEDFEAFLILTNNAIIQKVINHINTIATREDDDGNYQELLEEYLDDEATEADLLWIAGDKILSGFNSFKENLETGKFSLVPEVGRLLSDSRKGVDATYNRTSEAKHRYIYVKLLRAIYLNSQQSQEVQQLKSWTDALAKYL